MEKKFHILLFLIIASITSFAQSVRQHTVQRGETLASIAEKYGLSEAMLIEANPSSKKYVVAGMTLKIPFNEVLSHNKNDNTNTSVINDIEHDVIIADKKKKTSTFISYSKTKTSNIFYGNERKIEERNNVKGVCDENGEIVIPFEYDWIEKKNIVKNAFVYIVAKDGIEGVFDKDGKVIISTDRGYGSIDMESHFETKYKTLFGRNKYNDYTTGYYKVARYNAKDKKHKKPLYGVCDINGYEIIEPLYYAIDSYGVGESNFDIQVNKKSKKQAANVKLDDYGRCTEIPLIEYEEYQNYTSDNYILDSIRALYVEYKAQYDVPWKINYDRIEYDGKYDIFYVTKGDSKGVCTRVGKEIIPISRQYKYVKIDSDGGFFTFNKNPQYSHSLDGDYYGVCDRSGKEIIPPMFKYIITYNRNSQKFTVETGKGDFQSIYLPLDEDGCYYGSITTEDIAQAEIQRRQRIQAEKEAKQQEIFAGILQGALLIGNTILQTKASGSSGNVSSVNSSSVNSSSSSSSSTSKGKTCQLCAGSGDCQTCLGKGYYYSSFDISKRLVCPNCDKNNIGKCSSCHGARVK